MEIVHEARGSGGLFALGEGANRAELTYAPGSAPNTLVFDHTYVPPALRGQGLAEQLVDHAVADARERGMRVVPACSYVRALFARHPERYGDVVAVELGAGSA